MTKRAFKTGASRVSLEVDSLPPRFQGTFTRQRSRMNEGYYDAEYPRRMNVSSSLQDGSRKEPEGRGRSLDPARMLTGRA